LFSLFFLFPFLLFFVIPIKATHIFPGLAAFELIGLTGLWNRLLPINLDHAAHLGGLIF